MDIKSVLKPEGSVMAGIATVAAVYGIYNLALGSVNAVHATDQNHPSHESSRRKAGLSALTLVGALTLLTRDGNVGVLGFGTIVAMEVNYRHAIMANPNTGALEPVGEESYQPAQVVPFPVVSVNDEEFDAGAYPGR